MALQKPLGNQLQRCACYSYRKSDALPTANAAWSIARAGKQWVITARWRQPESGGPREGKRKNGRQQHCKPSVEYAVHVFE
jgi:hypothetical protein